MTAKEFVDIIVPEHNRTSCSDEDKNNGFYSRNCEGYGRCTRCMWLEIIDGVDIPDVLKEQAKSGDIMTFLG